MDRRREAPHAVDMRGRDEGRRCASVALDDHRHTEHQEKDVRILRACGFLCSVALESWDGS